MNDWDAYAHKLEAALDMRGGTGFRDLFAPGARFADPANCLLYTSPSPRD